MTNLTTALDGLKVLAERQRNERGDHLYKGSADPEIVVAIAALTEVTAALEQVAEPVAKQFRHKKRGTIYTLIGVGHTQGDLKDGDPVVLYRGEDGGLWARHQVEFCDGRFEEVAAPPAKEAS